MVKIESEITLRDIIDFIDLYIEENSICDNYAYLLSCCKTLGISSYTLNLLISSAKRNLKANTNSDWEIPSTVYLKLEKETKYVEVKETCYEYRTEKKWKWGLGFFFFLSIFFIFMAFTESGKRSELNKIKENEINNLTDSFSVIKNFLQLQYDSLVSIVDDKNVKIDSLITYEHNIGSPLYSGGGFDNGWVLWINVKSPIRINSSYVKADRIGEIGIVLYDKFYNELETKWVGVNKDFKRVKLNFEIHQTGIYALGIRNNSQINLQYHRTTREEEFQNYENFYLSICGSSSMKSDTIQKKYYQYFYDIDFTPLTSNK